MASRKVCAAASNVTDIIFLHQLEADTALRGDYLICHAPLSLTPMLFENSSLEALVAWLLVKTLSRLTRGKPEGP
jgi:hypothetical protein